MPLLGGVARSGVQCVCFSVEKKVCMGSPKKTSSAERSHGARGQWCLVQHMCSQSHISSTGSDCFLDNRPLGHRNSGFGATACCGGVDTVDFYNNSECIPFSIPCRGTRGKWTVEPKESQVSCLLLQRCPYGRNCSINGMCHPC